MNNLLERLVNAIFRQEGMPADWTNPGNLRRAPWLKVFAVQNGYWSPATRAEGVAGAAHVVALHVAEGNSLAELIMIWAPAADDNNTAAYIANVKSWTGIPDATVPLWTYIGV
jgi:hypothetical protein